QIPPPPPIVTNHAGLRTVLKCPERRFRLRAAAWVGAVAAACVWALAAACFCCLAGASPALAADPFWALLLDDGRPREPTIGVSASTIVQTTNFTIAAYARDGTSLWSASLDPDEEPLSTYFWEGLPLPDPGNPADDIIDPRVLFDHFSGRFVVGALREHARIIYLAVSHDDTPATGTSADWDIYYRPALDPDPGSGTIDWPGLAVNSHAIYFCAITRGQHVVQRFARPTPGDLSFYDNDPNRHRRWTISAPDTGLTTQQSFPMPATILDGSSADTMYFVQLVARGDLKAEIPAQLRVVAIKNMLAETEWIPDDPLDGAGAVDIDQWKQRCPDATVMNHKENIQNAVVREGVLYCTRATHYSGALPEHFVELPARSVARWHVVDLHGWPEPLAPDPMLVDSGVIDGGHVFGFGEQEDYGVQVIFPLIMPTADDGFALFFTRYHRLGYFDLCWTGKRAGDPPGVLGAPISVMQAGTAGIIDVTKPGDYEGIALDPLDPTRVWATGETGRCLPPAAPCTSCPVGQSQHFKHTVVGSYQVPTEPVKTLNIDRALGDQPDAIYVKVSACDAAQLADGELSAGEPSFSRTYGDGAEVTLLAPIISGWSFAGWIINIEADGPMAPTNRMTTITLTADRTATPYYVRQ
ncbi:MAG: hypothetical protein AB7Q17_18005, partial [Phycisphaerae bacterium]